ncbi:FUSC family protein [Ilyobacter polytropus]|uniref:Integral membrane bound transporter domain-containing protein n=1 Tax=Ilyobacter polytropus (strain ATCC 51220 / DSM 2926 / LMG 16218 / CuHBu1) TaxID=572544 RepID=E3H9M1_ILYPC|nr:FUSC family protein [Ilyobacter polytropus]ADO83410.1 conserved hypothetical protein [Ilyobacter polytropus DSM 2926]
MLNFFKGKFKSIFVLNKNKINFHIPLILTFLMGTFFTIGFYLNNIKAGLTASLAGLILVYFPIYATTGERIITLLACSFAFIFSYALGLMFSFNYIISSIVFGMYCGIIHWLTSYLMVRPPKSFFFVMIAATASCIPHRPDKIAESLGLFALGSIIVTFVAFVYSIIVNKNKPSISGRIFHVNFKYNQDTDLLEAIIFGIFMFISLLVGHLLKVVNPYWISVSCVAALQGASKDHVIQRVTQRIAGTFMGLGLCWITLIFANEDIKLILISIVILQFILEATVQRNYAIGIIFATPLTILLADASTLFTMSTTTFMKLRLFNTLIGCLIGALGGVVIHHEKLKYELKKKLKLLGIGSLN